MGWKSKQLNNISFALWYSKLEWNPFVYDKNQMKICIVEPLISYVCRSFVRSNVIIYVCDIHHTIKIPDKI